MLGAIGVDYIWGASKLWTPWVEKAGKGPRHLGHILIMDSFDVKGKLDWLHTRVYLGLTVGLNAQEGEALIGIL